MRIFKETGDCVNGIEYLFILSKADDSFIILGVWFSYRQVTWSELGESFRFYCHFYIKEKASSLLGIGKAQRNTAPYAFSLATSLPPLCTPPPRKKKRKRKEGQEKIKPNLGVHRWIIPSCTLLSWILSILGKLLGSYCSG